MEKKYTTFLNKTTSAYDLLKYLGSNVKHIIVSL